MAEDQGGALDLFDHIGHCESLAGACDTEKYLRDISSFNAC